MSYIKKQKGSRPVTANGLRHRRNLKKPNWDSTVNDLTVHQATAEELERRKEVARSKNVDVVKLEKHEKKVAKVRKKASQPNSADKRKIAILREILHDQDQFQEVLAKSDKAMDMVKDLFGDHPKRYTGFPYVTSAPGEDSDDGLPKKPELNTSQLEALSDSMMDKFALNENSSYDEEESRHEEIILNYKPKLDVNRFQDFVAKLARQEFSAAIGRENSDYNKNNYTPVKLETPPKKPKINTINDSVKVQKTKKVIDKENIGFVEKEARNKNDLRKVLSNLENEISEYERLNGKADTSSRPEKQHQDTFSGYTIALIEAVSRLTALLRERDEKLKAETAIREQLSRDCSHMRGLIDAITADLLKSREQHKRLQQDMFLFKSEVQVQLQDLMAYSKYRYDVSKVVRPQSDLPDPINRQGKRAQSGDQSFVTNSSLSQIDVPRPAPLVQPNSFLEKQIADLGQEHALAQARIKQLQNLHSNLDIIMAPSPEPEKPVVTFNRPQNVNLAVDSRDKDEILKQLKELSLQQMDTQERLKNLRTMELKSVSPAISPIPQLNASYISEESIDHKNMAYPGDNGQNIFVKGRSPETAIERYSN